MLDHLSIKIIKSPLAQCANIVNQYGITANQTTLFGFVVGCFALPALMAEHYLLALIFILLNRVCDGLDGALARIQGITDAGGFLDISLDFLFYSLIPFGFVLANPEQNSIAGAFLIFSFIGTGISFLAFAAMASNQGINNPVYKHKSLYYMSGLTEGTETISCFILFCVFPHHFTLIAYIFGSACWFTSLTRIYSGFRTLNSYKISN